MSRNVIKNELQQEIENLKHIFDSTLYHSDIVKHENIINN